jgi:low affinity Fe/Cu permease
VIDGQTSPKMSVPEESATTRAHASFADFSTQVARWTGNHWAFLVAAALVVASLLVFGVEITNIAISIGTLLMVFILQNTQNRDSAALHLKLDEMVRAEPEARDDVRGVESRPAHEIDDLHLHEPDGSKV